MAVADQDRVIDLGFFSLPWEVQDEINQHAAAKHAQEKAERNMRYGSNNVIHKFVGPDGTETDVTPGQDENITKTVVTREGDNIVFVHYLPAVGS